MDTDADTRTARHRDGWLIGAGVLTWAAVAATSIHVDRLASDPREAWGAACVLAFIALFLGCLALPHGPRGFVVHATLPGGTA